MPTTSAGELEQLWESATLIGGAVESFGGVLGPEDHYGFVTPIQPAHRLLAAEHYLEVKLDECALGRPFPDDHKPVKTMTISGLGKVVPRTREPWDSKADRELKKWTVESLLAYGQAPEVPTNTRGNKALLLGEHMEEEQPYLGVDVFTWNSEGIKSRSDIFKAGIDAVEHARAKQDRRFYTLLGRYMVGSSISVEETAAYVRDISRRIGSAFQRQHGMLRAETFRYDYPNSISADEVWGMPIKTITYDRTTPLMPDPAMPHVSEERYSSTWIVRSPESIRHDLFLHVHKLVNGAEVDPEEYVAVFGQDDTGTEVPIGINVERWDLALDRHDDEDRHTKMTAETVGEALSLLEPMRQTAQTVTEFAARIKDELVQLAEAKV